MRHPFSAIRPGEAAETAAACATILLVMAAHALLETARDTIFLANIPAVRLPWLYLAIAGLAVLGGPVLAGARSEAASRQMLAFLQLGAAAGTTGFLVLTRAPHPAVFYALYIWGGVAAAVVLVRFWLILTERCTAGQAKRLFPIVAAGAVLGSLCGYGIAGWVAWLHQPRALLAGSAVLFCGSAAASLLWWHIAQSRPLDAPSRSDAFGTEVDNAAGHLRQLRQLGTHSYVRLTALLLLLASIGVTVCDFAFKISVAATIPTARLGTVLATVYFACDLASAVLLVIAVGPLVRLAGVPQALMVRPTLLLASGAVFAVVGGWPAALLLRGVDGALRWSLHKTAAELLYVPMAPRVRRAVKEVSDLLAHRGGQALGSLLILGWVVTRAPHAALGLLIVAIAAVWLTVALSLRRAYVGAFRETLTESAVEPQLAFPELDLTSLEALLAALNSPDDSQVLAALDLLAATGRAHIVPALILYHPSPAVVERALSVFITARRRDVLPFGPRLLDHPDVAVAAASVRACAAVGPAPEFLAAAAAHACSAVSATASIARAALGQLPPPAAVEALRARVGDHPEIDPPTARAIARALRMFPVRELAPLLTALAAAPDALTRREAALAIGALRDPAHLPLLVGALGDRAMREAARTALLGYGAPALLVLERALQDLSLPRLVRIHLPRTIARFGHQHAAEVLLRHLLVEPAGLVRYKIVRGLGHLVAAVPRLRLDAALLEQVVDDHLAKIVQLLDWQATLAGGGNRLERHTPGQELLRELLAQKEAFAIERVFRLLALYVPAAGLRQIYDGLQRGDAAARSSGRELLAHVVPARWRTALLALTDDASLAERLEAAGADYRRGGMGYDGLILELTRHPSETLAALARHHACEIALPCGDGRSDGGADQSGAALLRQRRRAGDGGGLRNAG